MKAIFRTNLDTPQPYVNRLNDGAHDSRDYAVGDEIMFYVDRKETRGFTLRVCARRVYPCRGVTEIELHQPSHSGSIREFEDRVMRILEDA